MRSTVIRKYFPVVCLLINSIYAGAVVAGWNENQGYGGFPPEDIDQQIQNRMNNMFKSKENSVQSNGVADGYNNMSSNSNQTQNNPIKQYSRPSYQAPGYGRYNRDQYAPPRGNNTWNNQEADFNMPWGNNGSNAAMPWSNRGSNFSGPWNGNGSNFSAPWSNNGSSFNGPWNNNGSGFIPWGNSGGR